MRKYFKAIAEMSSNSWFEGIENRDPIEEIGSDSTSIKIVLSFIFIPILFSPLYKLTNIQVLFIVTCSPINGPPCLFLFI